MKKILMIVAPEGFRDIEYIVPHAFFLQQGISVKTTSLTPTAKGRFGYGVTTDFLLEDANAADYDGIFFVGGGGSLIYQDNKTAAALAETTLKRGFPVGAICAAPRLLLAWGFLKGKRCTGFEENGEFAALCKEAGAIYTGKRVETDGLICTGSGPLASEEMSLEFLRLVDPPIKSWN